MTFLGWFIVFMIVQIIHYLGTWKLYEKAGRKSWEALVPIYNAIILMKIINRPSWYVILLFIPVVNLLMFTVLWVETIRSFGKNSNKDTWLVLLTFGFYIYYLNYVEINKLQYVENRSLKPKNFIADFISSVVFGVIVATVIHTYFIQPFIIPTGSLEKTLLVGDYLLVSKVHYGARVPNTAVAMPMMHDSIYLIPTSYEGLPKYINRYKSYLNKPQIPYLRFPGFASVKKNDIVVFNWPADTIRYYGDKTAQGIRKPVDKKSNYVKRCVATAGDTLVGKNGDLYINGELLKLSDRARPQYMTNIVTKEGTIEKVLNQAEIKPASLTYRIKKQIWDDQKFQQHIQDPKNGVYLTEQSRDSLYVTAFGSVRNQELIQRIPIEVNTNQINTFITVQQAEALTQNPDVVSVNRVSFPPDKSIFPHTKGWSVDNFGPIYIPQKGATITLDRDNLPFYQTIIKEYEHNNLKVVGDDIYINDKLAKTYTFKQNYYWMMGDNRHNSEDSRMWGFVPEDHILGKPVFIWFSRDAETGKIRWERVFTTVGGDGEPVSYLRWFLIVLGLYFVAEYFWKKKKKDKLKDL